MLIATIVVLSLLLIASIIGNILLFKNAEFWRETNDLNESRLVDLKLLTEKVYQDMKAVDNQEWFQKDDEVGVVFTEIVNIIKWFNEFVQNEEEVESGEIEKE